MKRIGIAELKAHLSEVLQGVRRGHRVIVMDRKTPVAEIVPLPAKPEPLVVRKGKGRLRDLRFPPPIPGWNGDIVDLLLEDRRKR